MGYLNPQTKKAVRIIYPNGVLKDTIRYPYRIIGLKPGINFKRNDPDGAVPFVAYKKCFSFQN